MASEGTQTENLAIKTTKMGFKKTKAMEDSALALSVGTVAVIANLLIV